MTNYNFGGRVSSNGESLMTSSEVSSNINKAIYDLQLGGGVNLLDGTLDFSGDKWGNRQN